MLQVAVTMPAAVDDTGEFVANVRALEAAGAEMIALEGDGPEHWIALGALAAVTDRIRIRVTGSAPEALQRLSHGRVIEQAPEGETWVEVSMPVDKDTWIAM